jgi:biotin transport system substrate-specific component
MQQSVRPVTLADALLPGTTLGRQVSLVVGFSVFNALAAQVAIPLPFTPVPITAQTFAVLLTGMLLGSRLGALTLLTYLVEGLLGLPVFSGGRAGPAHLLGPTGGYLVGFVAAAYVAGLLAERGWDRRAWTTALAMAIGNLVIYAVGVSWLTVFVGPERALALGIVPFLGGDLLKVVLATVLLPGAWRFVGASGIGRQP